jgi:hypothetical protein
VNASDRIALLLGRSLIRIEGLIDELEEAIQKIAKLETEQEKPPAKKP